MMEESFISMRSGVDAVARNRRPLFICGFCLLFVLLFLYFFYVAPARHIGPEQPIPFSHRLHSGVKLIQCEFCHPYVGRSKHPGMPPVEKCLCISIPGHPRRGEKPIIWPSTWSSTTKGISRSGLAALSAMGPWKPWTGSMA